MTTPHLRVCLRAVIRHGVVVEVVGWDAGPAGRSGGWPAFPGAGSDSPCAGRGGVPTPLPPGVVLLGRTEAAQGASGGQPSPGAGARMAGPRWGGQCLARWTVRASIRTRSGQVSRAQGRVLLGLAVDGDCPGAALQLAWATWRMTMRGWRGGRCATSGGRSRRRRQLWTARLPTQERRSEPEPGVTYPRIYDGAVPSPITDRQVHRERTDCRFRALFCPYAVQAQLNSA